MSYDSISVGLVNHNVKGSKYWLRLKVKSSGIENGMTIPEAADIIDSTYNITPCRDEGYAEAWSQDTSELSANTISGFLQTYQDSIETEKAYVRMVEAVLGQGLMNSCFSDKSNLLGMLTYDITVQAYRSHQEELYKLQMSNGQVLSTTHLGERVSITVDVKDTDNFDFDMPIVRKPGSKPPVMLWQGCTSPKLHIIGNSVYWEGKKTGTIRAEFWTEWDELLIRVTGDYNDVVLIEGTNQNPFGTGFYSGSEDADEIKDYQNIQCSVLAFYHCQYSELILNRPETDTSVSDADKVELCHFILQTDKGSQESNIPPYTDENRPDCRQHINETFVCQCNGVERSDNRYEIIPCPDGVPAWTLLPPINKKSYADCGDRDNVHNPDYYESKCCVPWPYYPMGDGKPLFFPTDDMPWCKTSVRKFTSIDSKEKIKEYPAGTNIIPVAPGDGFCGEHVIEQVVNQEQCCEGAEPVVWDFSNSITVIADGGSGIVAVTGGTGSRYEWSVRGAGFYVNASRTQRDVVTSTPYLTIFTQGSCGTAQVYVTDGCSSGGCAVMSSVGQWQEVSAGGGCATSSAISEWDPPIGVYDPWTKDVCGIRVEQYITYKGGSVSGECSDQVYPNCGKGVPTEEWPPDLCISGYPEWFIRHKYPGFVGDVSIVNLSGDWWSIYFDGVAADGSNCGPTTCTAPAYARCCGSFQVVILQYTKEWVC